MPGTLPLFPAVASGALLPPRMTVHRLLLPSTVLTDRPPITAYDPSPFVKIAPPTPASASEPSSAGGPTSRLIITPRREGAPRKKPRLPALPVTPISRHPSFGLRQLAHLFDIARTAADDGDAATALEHFRIAMRRLASPLDGDAANDPLYCCILNGGQLLKEAIIGTALYGERADVPEVLTMIDRYLARPPADEEEPYDFSSLALVKAYTILRHASAAHHPDLHLLDRARTSVSDLAHSLAASNDPEKAELRFFAKLLEVEFLARMLVIAQERRNGALRHSALEDMRAALHALALHSFHEGEYAHKELIAEYGADVAILLARLGLWRPALERARTVVNTHPFEDTPAAARLLREPIFAPFVDGGRFLDGGEICMRARDGAWRRRIRAAIAHARFASIGQAAKAGAIAMITGIAANAFFRLGHEIAVPALLACLVTTFGRLLIGWQSGEAEDAFDVGVSERSAKESARDVARLLVKGAGDAFLWAIPPMLLGSAAESSRAIVATLSHAGALAQGSLAEIGQGIAAMADRTAAVQVTDALTALDPANTLYHIATKAAGAFFLVRALWPDASQRLSPLALALLPAACCFSADLGMAIAGTAPLGMHIQLDAPAFADRTLRAAIAASSAIVSLGIPQAAAIAGAPSAWEALKAFGHTLAPSRTDYGLVLSAAIAAGIASPLGGLLQQAVPAPNAVAIGLQGAAIAYALLPITLTAGGAFGPLAAAFHGSGAGARRDLRSLVLRAAVLGTIPASLRALTGWDTNPGQLVEGAVDALLLTGIARNAWPRAGFGSATRARLHEHLRLASRALATLQRQGPIASGDLRAQASGAFKPLSQFLARTATSFSLLHPLFDHPTLSPRFNLFVPMDDDAGRPDAASHPDGSFYAALRQALLAADAERWQEDEVAALLAFVKVEAEDPEMQAALRPLVRALASIPEEPFTAFFAEHPWLLDLFDVDAEAISAGRLPSARTQRKRLERALRTAFRTFEQLARAQGQRAAAGNPLAGLFTADRTAPPPPKDGTEGRRSGRGARPRDKVPPRGNAA
jgi:hypothetical protein